MSDEKKTAPKDALDEKTLEGVSGGLEYLPPFSANCPCGIRVYAFMGPSEILQRVQCPKCGRWYRLDGATLVPEEG